MITKQQIEKAEALGRRAFQRGYSRVPFNDVALFQIETKAEMQLARAWLRGFDAARLKFETV